MKRNYVTTSIQFLKFLTTMRWASIDLFIEINITKIWCKISKKFWRILENWIENIWYILV